MEVPWDDMHQPHSLLLWLLGFYDKQKIPQKLLCLKLALYLLQSLMGQHEALTILPVKAEIVKRFVYCEATQKTE